MAGFVEFIFSWMQLVVPQPCFDEFFVNYNFFDGMYRVKNAFTISTQYFDALISVIRESLYYRPPA